jgi:CheY-like chemotaxis protein
MSHEIRTPMNAILGFSEALYHKLDSGQLQKMVKSILSSGNLLLSLLNDILDLSKIEAGKLEILPQPLDLLSIVDEIRLLFSDKAAKKGIDLDVRVGDAFPPVLLLDEIRIKQVVFNLVGNAIKFTHKGHVRICLSFVPLSGTSGNVQIDVSDTGIGIVKTQQEVIFEAFRQQSGQSNRNYEGVGLGLAIARRLVEKMSGSITVSSIVGEGSTFTVLIPGVEASVVEIRKREFYDDQQDVIFDNATILVVDDVSSNIEAVESLLASNGLSFIAAENGEMAVEILKHTCPDLILLDIRMPGIDGFEVARQVKENTHRKHIPVIAFTASVFSSERIESSTNFEGFVFKPVNKLELLTQFKRFLRFTVVTPPAPLVTAQLPVQVLPQAVNCLPQLFEQLNSTMRTRWETLKDSLVLFNIEAFANELAAVACEHSFDYLDEYAKKLLSDVDSVDLESIRDTLSQFPAIIDVVGRLRDNQQDSQPLQPIR